jgi:Bifunctional DNA primase/polymerase, N-terminal
MNARATLDAALGLALPVFPCLCGNKRPATPHGFLDASADPEVIRKFDWHNRLIGVATGAVSGIDVLDIDPQHGGDDWHEANKHRLPATRVHQTRSGGWHRLFQHADGLRCSTGKIALGIDVRADGGYIIWWPAEGLTCEDYPPSGLPEWPSWVLFSMVPPPVQPASRYARLASPCHSLKGIIGTIANARQGERNSLVFWGTCRAAELVGAGIIAEQFAEQLLVEAAASAGLPYAEARVTVRSGLRQGARHG